jgi:UDP-N-acetylmuramyl pentapeptide phosphotransferase/UDP-N-acetylglucosamine-1-phosphate transferase
LFLVGLLEDLGYPVSPMRRLAATGLASFAVILLTGTVLDHTGIVFLDDVSSLWIVAAGITLFATMGLSNAFNLIDGVHGLAGLNAIVTAIALALIARNAGYDAIVLPLLVIACGTLGYLALNFPFGAIFLGDAGAYTLGFVLAWFGIEILAMAPEVSPWPVLLTMFWPVADTCIAIFRRLRRSVPAMMPDRLHVHQLVMRGIEIIWLGKGRRHISNPLTTIILAPFVIAPPVAGVLLWDRPGAALVAALICAAVFVGGYSAAVPILRRLAPSAALATPSAPARSVPLEVFSTQKPATAEK